MIISASRRTDIPAFYSDWFFKRIAEEFCIVKNPFNPSQTYRVSLMPEDVDAIVFWSKNPEAIIHRLPELDAMGFRYYFQFTLNNYPKELEGGVPPLKKRIGTFIRLSNMLGFERVIWRYDPIIISNITGHDYHYDKFSSLCEKLGGYTKRVMVSVVEYYKKTVRNLKRLEPDGYKFDFDARQGEATDVLLEKMAKIANNHGIEILSCAQVRNYEELGIKPGSCVDGELINRLWGLDLHVKKDPGQRKFCLCSVSKDIGMNDTCTHDCPYCYATKNHDVALKRYKEHNPNSPCMYGECTKAGKTAAEQQVQLF
jgi:hypothetical protein